jgi:diketogulonate reductase-like aldo/keto reductase
MDRTIPGTTTLHRLEENLVGADVELSSGDLQEIEQVLVLPAAIPRHRQFECSFSRYGSAPGVTRRSSPMA